MFLTTGYSGVVTDEKVRELGFRALLRKPTRPRCWVRPCT